MDVTLYSPGTFQDGNIPQAGSDSLLENFFFFKKRMGGEERKKALNSTLKKREEKSGPHKLKRMPTDDSWQG